MDSKGKRVLGTHESKESAAKQLTAIHISQHEKNEEKLISFGDFISEDLVTIQYHDQLNPKLWDGFDLKPEVREKLIEIGNAWIEWAGFPSHAVKEYLFVGGNANFNYTDKSDIDLHILVDPNEIADCPDFIDDYFEDKRNLWAMKHDIKIYGLNVEVSPQDIDQKIPANQGVYSLSKNEWIAKPVILAVDIKGIPGIEKVDQYKKEIETTLAKNEDHDEIKELKNRLKNLRRDSIKNYGEFGVGNLIFKELRNLGYFEKLNQKMYSRQDSDLSL